jgi:[acyl-carrier-protein] S-malonyltransferase
MTKKIAFLFPGQGAQYVGMGRDFFDNFKEAKELFEEADDTLKIKLSTLIFEGDAKDLNLTQNSQVAIYTVSSAILKVFQSQFAVSPFVCAGLSLGEYTALVAAGYFTFSEGLRLVQKRGEGMHEACLHNPGCMAVVLGLTEDLVEEEMNKLSQSQVWAANFNCPGQVVISGTNQGIAIASEVLKKRGAKRILPLPVEGAFHTPLMNEAKSALQDEMTKVKWGTATAKLVMNTPGDFVDKSNVEKMLIEQVVSPVRWERGIHAMINEEVDCFIEIGPGKTLSGMNKKIGVTVPTTSIEKVDEVKSFIC